MKLNNSLFMRLGLLVIVLLMVVGVSLVWWNDSTAPVDPTDTKPVIFVIEKGVGIRTIAANLAAQGLIRSPTGFYLMVKLLGVEKQIQAGDFRLNKAMDTKYLTKELTHGILDVWVTTLEGWRVEEIASRLSRDLDIPEQEFIRYAKEGYMFPDTYLIPRDATAAAISTLFIKTFNNKITDQMKLDSKKIGLSIDEVVILASIVEREGRTDEDRPVIAGILLKRLKADWPLQTDATLQYALGYQPFEKTWWKKELSIEDKEIKSPYNTYLHTGLPPGPISNPGFAALKAVIYPVQTEYWYYLHDPKGQVHYGKTIEEHNANINLYLR